MLMVHEMMYLCAGILYPACTRDTIRLTLLKLVVSVNIPGLAAPLDSMNEESLSLRRR